MRRDLKGEIFRRLRRDAERHGITCSFPGDPIDMQLEDGDKGGSFLRHLSFNGSGAWCSSRDAKGRSFLGADLVWWNPDGEAALETALSDVRFREDLPGLVREAGAVLIVLPHPWTLRYVFINKLGRRSFQVVRRQDRFFLGGRDASGWTTVEGRHIHLDAGEPGGGKDVSEWATFGDHPAWFELVFRATAEP